LGRTTVGEPHKKCRSYKHLISRLKDVPELVHLYRASANPFEVIVAKTELHRDILGMVDGHKPKEIEDRKEQEDRKNFLRKTG
jgi:adenosine/AMP kinase